MWAFLLHLALAMVSVAGDSKRLLVFVPGLSFKNEKSVKLLETNLNTIRETFPEKSVEFMCTIAVFDMTLPNVQSLTGEMAGCTLSLLQEGRFSDHVKMVSPALLQYGSIDWVFLMLDDVKLNRSNFNMSRLVRLAEMNNLSVTSPAVGNAAIPSTKIRPISLKKWTDEKYVNTGYVTQVVEFFATLFTPFAWGCLHEFVNPYYNTKGYLYDKYLYNFCIKKLARYNQSTEFKLGVIQNMTADHMPWEIGRKRQAKASSWPHNFHDKWFMKGLSKSDSCQNMTSKCKLSALEIHRRKYDYHWDWSLEQSRHNITMKLGDHYTVFGEIFE